MFGKLFKKKPQEPVATWSHPELGFANWDPNQQVWIGLSGGLPYSLAYDPSGQPSPSLVAYASRFLANPSLFNDIIVQAKSQATRTFSEFLKDEIDLLQPGMLQFFKEEKEHLLFIVMLGGPVERPWKIRYKEIENLGLTFKQF
jgi:hypothetical protein